MGEVVVDRLARRTATPTLAARPEPPMPPKEHAYTVKDTDNLSAFKAAAKGSQGMWWVLSPSATDAKKILAVGAGTSVPKNVLEDVQQLAAARGTKVFLGLAPWSTVGGRELRSFKAKGTAPGAEVLHAAVDLFAGKAAVKDCFPTLPADILFDPKRMKEKGGDTPPTPPTAPSPPSSASPDTADRSTTDTTPTDAPSLPPDPAADAAQRDFAKARISKQRIEQLLKEAGKNAALAKSIVGWRDELERHFKTLSDAKDNKLPAVGALQAFEAFELQVRSAVTKTPKPPVPMKKVDVGEMEKAVGAAVGKTLEEWKKVEDPLDNPTGSLKELRDILRELKSWELAKKHPRAHDLFAYRKEVVDKCLSKLRKDYPTLVWKSVGSMSWSSDYDITVATEGGLQDTAVVRGFNTILKTNFGVQPGTLFDTNLYVRDYADVIGKDAGQAADKDKNTVKNTEKPQKLRAMMQAGQDMGALMKQRRYMSEAAWGEYMRATLGDIERETLANSGGSTEGDARRAIDELLSTTRKQFEEADANFQISEKRLRDKAAAILGGDKAKVLAKLKTQAELIAKAAPDQAAAATRLLQAYEKAQGEKELKSARQKFDALLGETMVLAAASSDVTDTSGTKSEEEVQAMFDRAEALAELETSLEEEDADSTLEASNLLYLEGMDEVRKLEAEAAALLKEADEKLEQSRTATPEGDVDVASLLAGRASSARTQAEAKLEKARTKAAEAIFFAAEAYHTQGAVEHVVAGIQGSKLTAEEESQARDEAGRSGITAKEAVDEFIKGKQKEKQKAALDPVDAWSVLQSFNENVGDFFKDMEHYGKPKNRPGDEDALVNVGKAFVKASKYLERMFDCVGLLKVKLQFEGRLPFETSMKDAGEMQRAIAGGVLLVRKGAQHPTDSEGTPLSPEAAEKEGYRYAEDELEKIFGARGVEGLQTKVTAISRDVNSWIRRAIQKQQAHAGVGEEQLYFKA